MLFERRRVGSGDFPEKLRPGVLPSRASASGHVEDLHRFYNGKSEAGGGCSGSTGCATASSRWRSGNCRCRAHRPSDWSTTPGPTTRSKATPPTGSSSSFARWRRASQTGSTS